MSLLCDFVILHFYIHWNEELLNCYVCLFQVALQVVDSIQSRFFSLNTKSIQNHTKKVIWDRKSDISKKQLWA